MSKRLIRADLEGRLKTWADAQNPPLPIAFEGAPFVKPVDKCWLQCWLLPAPTRTWATDAQRHREVGVFQVTVYGPDKKGTAQIENIAEQIVDLFPVYPKFATTSIEQRGTVTETDVDDVYRCVHVSFVYRREL